MAGVAENQTGMRVPHPCLSRFWRDRVGLLMFFRKIKIPTLSHRTRQGRGTLGSGIKDWRYAVVIFCKTRLRELQLQFGEDFNRSLNLVRPLSDSLRHLQQNAMD